MCTLHPSSSFKIKMRNLGKTGTQQVWKLCWSAWWYATRVFRQMSWLYSVFSLSLTHLSTILSPVWKIPSDNHVNCASHLKQSHKPTQREQLCFMMIMGHEFPISADSVSRRKIHMTLSLGRETTQWTGASWSKADYWQPCECVLTLVFMFHFLIWYPLVSMVAHVQPYIST